MFEFIIGKGIKEWFLDEKIYHRKKGPAIEWKNGEKWWFKHGKRHRENSLPAIENSNGEKEYYFNGQQYILQENGTKEFINSYTLELHRKNLPAVEYPNGDKEWWLFGKRHREYGPAVIYGNKQFWFEHGKFIKCSVF